MYRWALGEAQTIEEGRNSLESAISFALGLQRRISLVIWLTRAGGGLVLTFPPAVSFPQLHVNSLVAVEMPP